MFMVKIGDPEFWAEYDASKDEDDFPLKEGDRIYWAGTHETSKGTIAFIQPEYEDSVVIRWDRYQRHGPDQIRLEENELRSPNGRYYKIVGSE